MQIWSILAVALYLGGGFFLLIAGLGFGLVLGFGDCHAVYPYSPDPKLCSPDAIIGISAVAIFGLGLVFLSITPAILSKKGS